MTLWKGKRALQDDCKQKRIAAAESAIKMIEVAKDQPKPRMIGEDLP